MVALGAGGASREERASKELKAEILRKSNPGSSACCFFSYTLMKLQHRWFRLCTKVQEQMRCCHSAHEANDSESLE